MVNKSESGPFNWVKARADCNLDLSFRALRSVVKRDVQIANEIPALTQQGTKFVFHTEAQGHYPMFGVRRLMGGQSTGQANFEQLPHQITVDFGSGSSRDALAVTALWDDEECACRLMVDGVPCEVWEVSRRALEWLFFSLAS